MNLFKLTDFSDPAKQQAIAAFAEKKYGRPVAPERIGVIARNAKDLEVVDLDEYESAGGMAKTVLSQAAAGLPSTIAGAAAYPVGALASGFASSPTGLGAVALGLLGGTATAAAAGTAADVAAMKGLGLVAPKAVRELENQRLINPKLSTLGQVASGFGLAKNSLGAIKRVVGERLGKTAAEVTGKDLAKIVGAEAGVNVGAEVGTQIALEGDIDPFRVGAAALGAPVQLKQTRLGQMVTGAGERLAGRLSGPRAATSNPELPNEKSLPIPDHTAERNAAIDEFLAAGEVDPAKAQDYYQRILRRPAPPEVDLPSLRKVAQTMALERQQNDPAWRAGEAGKAYDALQAGVDAAQLPQYPWLSKLVSAYKQAPAMLSRDQFVAAARGENPMAGIQQARSENLPAAVAEATEAQRAAKQKSEAALKQSEESEGGAWLEQLADQAKRQETARAIYAGIKSEIEGIVLPTDAYSRKLARAVKEGTIANSDELEQVATLGANPKLLEDELNKLRVIRLQELGSAAASQLPPKQPGQVMDPAILGRTAQRLAAKMATPGSKDNPPVPENKKQIQAQVDLTAKPKSPKAITVLDPGSPTPDRVPANLEAQQVGERVALSNPKQIHADTAAAIVGENVINPVVLAQSKSAAITPAADKVVTTSTPEVKDVLTHAASTPKEVADAVAAQQAAVPGGRTEIKTPEQVVAERQAALDAEANRARGAERYDASGKPIDPDVREFAVLQAELNAASNRLHELNVAGKADTEAGKAAHKIVSGLTARLMDIHHRLQVADKWSADMLKPWAPAPAQQGTATAGTLAKAPRARKPKAEGAAKEAKAPKLAPKTPDSATIAKLLDDTDTLAFVFAKSGDINLMPEGLKAIKVPGGEIIYNPDKNANIEDLVRKHQNKVLNEGDVRHSGAPKSIVRTGFQAVDWVMNGMLTKHTSSVHDRLRALADPRGALVADADARADAYAKQRYAADHIDYTNAFKGLTPQEKTQLNLYMFDMKEQGYSAIKLPAKLANRVDAIRTVLQRQLYDRYVADGPYIDGRLPNMDINYVPETISRGAMEVIKAGDSSEYRALEQDFVAYKVKMGASHAEAQDMWNNLVKAYSRVSLMSEPIYNAVRRIEGTGLPASMRAPLEEALFKHAALTHRDVAWFKEFQQNKDVAEFLGLTDDGKGNAIALNNPSPEPVAKTFMANASSWRNYNKTWLDTISRLASAGRLGTFTGLRDFFMTVPNLSAYLDTKDLPKVVQAFQRTMTTNTETAVRAGAINPDRVQGADIDTLTPDSLKIEMAERLADVLRKYQGRELFEAKGRQMAFELGRIVGIDKSGDQAWLKRLFGNDEWKVLKGPELLDAIGRKFVEKSQGNYGMSGLPPWMLDNSSSPFARMFFKLGRYQVERFNNWYKDAWTPAVKGETYAPLLKSIVGGLVGAGAVNELLAAIGIKPNALLPSELLRAGAGLDKKELAYTVFSYLDTAGTIGLLGNLSYAAAQLANRELPRTFMVNLGIDSMVTAINRLVQFAYALDEGAESPEALATLAGTIARDNVQLYREIHNKFVDRNMAREERIYKRQTDQNTWSGSMHLDNPFDPVEGLRRATTLEEAQAAMPGVSRKMEATGIVPVLRTPLRSLEINPLRPDRPNFYQWLEGAQGLDVAAAQGAKDLAGDELTQDKRALIGVARNDLIRRAADLQRLRQMQRVMEP